MSFRARQRQRADAARTKQHALLAGLLFCHGCNRPDDRDLHVHGGRRFPTMLPKGRQNGWDSCGHQGSPGLPMPRICRVSSFEAH